MLVPVNFMLTGPEVAFILEHSGAVGLIVEDALLPVAEQALTKSAQVRVRAIIGNGGAPAPGVPAPVRGVLGRALPLTKGVVRQHTHDPDWVPSADGFLQNVAEFVSAMADLGSARRRTCPCLSLSESTTC